MKNIDTIDFTSWDDIMDIGSSIIDNVIGG